jgi:hypothetical protein
VPFLPPSGRVVVEAVVYDLAPRRRQLGRGPVPIKMAGSVGVRRRACQCLAAGPGRPTGTTGSKTDGDSEQTTDDPSGDVFHLCPFGIMSPRPKLPSVIRLAGYASTFNEHLSTICRKYWRNEHGNLTRSAVCAALSAPLFWMNGWPTTKTVMRHQTRL